MLRGAQVNARYGTASLTTALAGDDNDLVYTAQAVGYLGNYIAVAYLDPGAPDSDLAVDVEVVESVSQIQISLATDGSSSISTLASDIASAISASSTADALVSVADAPANDGSGALSAMAASRLTGGGATPLFDPDPSGNFAQIVNRGSGSVFLGDEDVTTSDGFELKPTDGIISLTVGSNEVIYAAASTTTKVDVLLTYAGA